MTNNLFCARVIIKLDRKSIVLNSSHEIHPPSPPRALSILVFSPVPAILLAAAISMSQDNNNDKQSFLCQGYYQTEAQAEAQLKRLGGKYKNADEWRARAKGIRRGIVEGAELDPLAEKCSLKPIMHSKRHYHGYTVENGAFGRLPGA